MTNQHHRSLIPCCAIVLGLVACSAGIDSDSTASGDLGTASQSVTTLTLSGHIRDASGIGIAGITVTLAGKANSTQVTNATGAYSFTSLAAGSYSLRPTKDGCAITPNVVNLNNLKASKIVDFTGSGAGCSGSTSTAHALMLVDPRLQSLLTTELEQYRAAASARRGFSIELRAVSNIDDWSPTAVRTYVTTAKSANPALEGVLYIGNIKIPSFYKIRADVRDDRLYPVYFEDLDATFARNQAPGTVDPTCNGTNDPYCVVGDPGVVPQHDFDAITQGTNPGPELWASFLPVGVASSANAYADFANQLRPYLAKVNSYYAGQLVTNKRLYFMGNGTGERFTWSWDAYGGAGMDFYGKPGPHLETGDACIVNGQNLCYQRWATETFASAADFQAYYDTFPWVAEGWQSADIFTAHMNANLYDAVEVTTHGDEWGTIINSPQARALTKTGLLVTFAACRIASFAQPNSPSFVDTVALASDNYLLAYLYGTSKALAAMGAPALRTHYGNFPLVFRELRVNHSYLGAAHRAQMVENYSRAGSDPQALKDWANEMLLGDPFMDLR